MVSTLLVIIIAGNMKMAVIKDAMNNLPGCTRAGACYCKCDDCHSKFPGMNAAHCWEHSKACHRACVTTGMKIMGFGHDC